MSTITTIAFIVIGIFFAIFTLAFVPAMIASAIEEKWKSSSRMVFLGYDNASFAQAFSKGAEPNKVDVSGLASWPHSLLGQVSFGGAVSRAYVGWQDFKGRASRSEYWYWYLFLLVASLLISGIALLSLFFPNGIFKTTVFGAVALLSVLFIISTIVPGIAISVRRLHDTGRSGWWILIAFFPVVGSIVLLVFFLLPSTNDLNRYGPIPFSGRIDESLSSVENI
jgi:uncharacterized membrane protein YhaH (DUF805 family)